MLKLLFTVINKHLNKYLKYFIIERIFIFLIIEKLNIMFLWLIKVYVKIKHHLEIFPSSIKMILNLIGQFYHARYFWNEKV